VEDADGRRAGLRFSEPLAPGPPKRWLAWLSLGTDRQARARARPWLISALILATIALGTWGFRELALPNRLSLLQSIYHAAKLYALDIGPADGSGGPGVGPNWQVLLALALAAMLVIRALLALAGALVRRAVARRLLSGHVIVCGAGVHGSRLARALSSEHDVVLLDPDAGAPGMRGAPCKHEWRILADAVEPDALLVAGARRASWLVAVAGDDYTNSQIVSSLLALGGFRDGMQVIVQSEDPSLGRFLEHTDPRELAAGEQSLRPALALVTPFSPNAIAADALLEGARARRGAGAEGPLLELGHGAAPYVLLAGDHPLLDAIVLAALRRWRVRILRELERPSGVPPAPIRVGLYGPGACARVERLRRRWLPEPNVLELEAKDAEAPEHGMAVSEAAWLAARRQAGHAFVACSRELDGVELSLRLSRLLGSEVLMTRVTTQPPSLLDERIRERTAADPHLAPTAVRAIDELAYDREAMAGAAAPKRLVRALEADHDPRTARSMSAELFAREHLGVHSDPLWRVVSSERALARPLVAPVPVSAMVSASLSIELESPRNLRTAAEALAREGRSQDALTAWCEYARHVTAASPDEERAGLELATGDELADTILRMRASTLGPDPTAIAAGAPRGPLAGATRVTIFAGAAGSISREAEQLLGPMLRRALDGYDGVILSAGTAAGLPGLVATAARELGLRVIGYAPADLGDRSLYPTLRGTAGASDFSMREPVGMWCDVLAAGIRIGDVRVVACADAPMTLSEMLLARALGAPVAWLDPAGDALLGLDDALPFGADGVLELPVDTMTLRAFTRWSAAPEDLPCALRDRVARFVHADYRRRQRARKRPDDGALAPWDQLLPELRRSNLSQAGDIPNKLAAVAKRLARPGTPLCLDDEQVELLAEIEHGRWNLERLRGGWRLGERELSRLISSYLRPWAELDDEAREFDREAVRNIAPALADAGWGVEDLPRADTATV
jgi:hypothetical protein